MILLATAVASFFLFLNKTYVWVNILVPLLYTGSVVSLVIATGSSSSGVGLVMLLSVVWSALYLEIWQSSFDVLESAQAHLAHLQPCPLGGQSL